MEPLWKKLSEGATACLFYLPFQAFVATIMKFKGEGDKDLARDPSSHLLDGLFPPNCIVRGPQTPSLTNNK